MKAAGETEAPNPLAALKMRKKTRTVAPPKETEEETGLSEASEKMDPLAALKMRKRAGTVAPPVKEETAETGLSVTLLSQYLLPFF